MADRIRGRVPNFATRKPCAVTEIRFFVICAEMIVEENVSYPRQMRTPDKKESAIDVECRYGSLCLGAFGAANPAANFTKTHFCEVGSGAIHLAVRVGVVIVKEYRSLDNRSLRM